jgi:hypothetical protein
VIVEPGGYGTDFGRNLVAGSDGSRTADAVADLLAKPRGEAVYAAFGMSDTLRLEG